MTGRTIRCTRGPRRGTHAVFFRIATGLASRRTCRDRFVGTQGGLNWPVPFEPETFDRELLRKMMLS
jgi:hypothetical protein